MASRLYLKLDPGLKIRVAWRHFLNRCKYAAPADPDAFIWVSPKQIVYHRRSFVPKWDLGRVVGGDWDKLDYFFDNLAKHKAIKARVEFGLAWEETGIFEYLEHFIATRKRAIDGCRTRKDMLLRYNMIDDLIESVRLNGYVPNNTIDKKMDHICVNIGRYGDIIFNGGGHHRLSLAKLFGVPRVPVLVIVRHKRWQRHRDQIARGLAAGADLNHPDLAAFAGKSGLVPPQNS